MQQVTIDRQKYIGGSDIPIIMNLSPFKTRYDLLLEKAELKETEIVDNPYIDYGNVMEEKIRDYINNSKLYKTNFVEGKVVEEQEVIGERYHSDGVNKDAVLEVKTTSKTHEKVDEYITYVVQLLQGMLKHQKKKGTLAVYERPQDFNTKFDKERLQIFNIELKDYKDLVEDIEEAKRRFKIDLLKLIGNPFLSEEELLPKEIVEISNQIVEIEKQLSEFKEIEEKEKNLKKKLFEAMNKCDIKKWTTPNNFKITKVDTKQDTEVIEIVFNEEKFKEENKELYEKYIEEKKQIKKGKSGYVLITSPKEEK